MNSLTLPYLERQQKLITLTPLIQRPWSVLLDSAGDDLNYNRYDVFSFSPSVRLSFDGVKTTVDTEHALPALTLSDPVKCLRTILNHFKTQQITHKKNSREDGLPFNGGWLGYISYDFGRHLETISDESNDDIELPQVQMGLYLWALITDHKKKTTKLYNFGLDSFHWSQICQAFDFLTNSGSITSEASSLPTFDLITNWQSNTSRDDYYQAFARIQEYIHNGDCYQVNYAQQFSARFSGAAYSAYQKLTLVNKAPFSAYLNYDDHQILSVSPERFIESQQGEVLTQPIKGTRPRSSDPQKDQALADELMNSPKDQAENLMIVDLLRNDLSKTADKGSVQVRELFGHYRFESVHHLISTISARLAPEFDIFDLLTTTLPGGSITGAPKIRAMQIIESLESVKRNLYCGIIGYLDFNGNMDTNICIRTLIAKNNHLYCWAGGGIVADSKVETEYQETFDKLARILPILKKNSRDSETETLC